jgi:hypothetical protein
MCGLNNNEPYSGASANHLPPGLSHEVLQVVLIGNIFKGALPRLQLRHPLSRQDHIKSGGSLRPLVDNLVYQAKTLGIFGGHVVVPLQRILDGLVILTGVLDVDLV